MKTLETYRARPFLKWAGGKTQLLEQFQGLYPEELKRGEIRYYFEPFLGGGAVFFDVIQNFEIEKAFLYDVNPEIVLVFNVVKRDVNKLIRELDKLQKKYFALSSEEDKKEFYYKERTLYNKSLKNTDFHKYEANWIKRAARMIFLNRTCFNGLFRQNRKGEFNVPSGKYKNPRISDPENLISVSQVLQKAEIRTGDFTKPFEKITEESFVYYDPPYRPISKTSAFTTYAKGDFGEPEQIRLAEEFRRVYEKGAKVMLSNSDPKNIDPSDEFFEDNFHGFNIHRVKANRMINSVSDKRGAITELVITNY